MPTIVPVNPFFSLGANFVQIARCSQARMVKPPKHDRAYNSYRLEVECGAVMSAYAVDARGYQDHYAVCPDGSMWRFRNPEHYYTRACGKAMMVCVQGPTAERD